MTGFNIISKISANILIKTAKNNIILPTKPLFPSAIIFLLIVFPFITHFLYFFCFTYYLYFLRYILPTFFEVHTTYFFEVHIFCMLLTKKTLCSLLHIVLKISIEESQIVQMIITCLKNTFCTI